MNKPITSGSLDLLNFDNRYVRELPGDPIRENSRRQVAGACFSYVTPIKVRAPQLVSYSPEVATLLEMTPEMCQSDQFLQVFSGNALATGMEPYAMCYGGHQFGNWAGQLGDGRAINLGEIVNSQNQRWVLQLKGAGPTPYSRTADGLAVLRSSVREYLCSEAMHHLGVPTTRALSLIETGELVERDMFYNGNPQDEPGAIVCRVSPSFIRFGNFEIFASRGENTLLQQFLDYTIQTDFPHLGKPGRETYLEWFREVCRTTAELIVHWMRVGFVHGVMNTDNMSILGLTIDYGPYGWLEDYNPGWTPNTTDAHGKRYCFGNQPHIAQWNLVQLANAIFPVINDKEGLGEALDTYRQTFQQGWADCIAQKLGLRKYIAETDEQMANELFDIMNSVETDMTIFFRKLADFDSQEASDRPDPLALFKDSFYRSEQLTPDYRERLSAWLTRYRMRLQQNGIPDVQRKAEMNRVNPKYVLRNYLAQLAIDKAEKGDYSLVNELLDLLRNPYDEQPHREKYSEKRPEWARNRPGCSMLSCSS
ncbi:MAG: YdiU family protein [Desulfocapsaceae bacterium]|nr:YdiU family protein [Desulfocapsaceae bacterium]